MIRKGRRHRKSLAKSPQKSVQPQHLSLPTAASHAQLLAAATGNAAEIRRLLNLGVPVDVLDSSGRSALELTIMHGHFDATRVLINSGATGGLHLAAAVGNWRVLQLILDSKTCSVDEITSQGFTALSVAAYKGHMTAAHLLIGAGAALGMMVPGANATPLHFATMMNNTSMMNLLISYGAQVDAVDADYFTSLGCASRCGHCEALLLLLEHGASIDGGPCSIEPPVITAAKANKARILQHIIYFAPEQVNSVNRDGINALGVASSEGFTSCMKVLNQAMKVNTLPGSADNSNSGGVFKLLE